MKEIFIDFFVNNTMALLHALSGYYYWLCQCVCGNFTEVSSNKLLQGKTVSCRCCGGEPYLCGQGPPGERQIAQGPQKQHQRHQECRPEPGNVDGEDFLCPEAVSVWGGNCGFAEAVTVYRKVETIRAEVPEDIGVLGGGAVATLAKRLEELRGSV